MIISHRHKFIFFRVPKTGSVTAEFMLRMCGAFDDRDIMTGQVIGQFPSVNIEERSRDPESPYRFGGHMTPDLTIEAGILTINQLREYDCYAYLREPHKRHLSGIVHGIGRQHAAEHVREMMQSTLHPTTKKSLGLLTIPQNIYFYAQGERVVEALDFDNYEAGLRRIIASVGGIDFPTIPRMNARNWWQLEGHTPDQFWTPKLEDEFEGDYAEDIELYQSIIRRKAA